MNPSRLLLNLDARIAAAKNPVTKDCLRAERAGYLARKGQFDDAKAAIDDLRQSYAPNPHAAVSAWLNLAEGLLIHSTNMGSQARDKIHRAYAFSAATGLTQLNAQCAAWLAHMDYLLVDMAGMTRHLREAFKLADQENHSARSRAHMVVALAYHLAGRLDLARPSYSKAHFHASQEGDETTISALMHNMAWLRSANQRQEIMCGKPISANGEHALASVESTLQFDILFKTTSLDALAPVLRAQVLSMKENYEAALAAYEEYLSLALQQGMNRLHADLLADQAWCRVNVGQTTDAMNDALAAEGLIDPDGQFDDRATAHSRLAQVFSALGDSSKSSMHRDLADKAWHGHTLLQSKTIELLEGLAV
jgi:tetratricopeptide (TPR) repeat protein